MKSRKSADKVIRKLLMLVSLGFLLSSCIIEEPTQVSSGQLLIEFDNQLYSRLSSTDPATGETRLLGPFSASETVNLEGAGSQGFLFESRQWTEISDDFGTGEQIVLEGKNRLLRKQVSITTYASFPNTAIFQVTYTNLSDEPLTLESWTNNQYQFETEGGPEPAFWSLQGGSYESRPDWVLPVETGFSQKNFQGMNASDYGGGIPVSDVWRRDVGIGVGHLAPTPKLVSLPVERPEGTHVTLGVEAEVRKMLQPGESFSTLPTFVHLHKGDFFETLTTYRNLMVKRGIKFPSVPKEAYEPIWCAWGYQRDFKLSQVYGTLPKVRDLGIRWVVLDDGWQNAEGDWYVLEEKFPGGERGMQRFVKRLHDQGFMAKLWWAPMAVDPGTDLAEEHPDYLLLNEDGSTQRISWWNADYLCPAYKPVQDYTIALVNKIIGEWDYDGLKIDGQHLNGAPPCYNATHNHQSPEESVEAVPEFFQLVLEAATRIKPNAVVEICPCGTTYSFFSLPVMNQAVSSDPTSSWQIRLKGKTIKALMGPQAPYYGDHVELSDGGTDFASSVGVGAVVGTKFTWPIGAAERARNDLTAEREEIWKQWLEVYSTHVLPLGTYRGELYDIGFDKPEGHAIQKGDRMYYAFFANEWSGELPLRGLKEGDYTVKDYVNDRDLGTVTGPEARLSAAFENHLLIEASPVD